MIYRVLIILLLLTSHAYSGTYRYIDQGTNEDGVTFSGVSGDSYTSTDAQFPGAGVGYRVLEDALDAWQSGDDLYLRGGSYTPVGRYTASGITDADFYLNYVNMTGTSEDHSSIQSYPGEWAVLELSGNRSVGLGHSNQDKSGSYRINYLDVTRLEIDGNSTGGIDWGGITINGRNNSFTYLYIHDVQNDSGATGQQGGLVLVIPADTEIKYNRFDDNGGTTSQNNCAHINLISSYSYTHNNCTTYHWFLDGPYDADNETRNVEIAYNYSTNPNEYADYFVKNKAHAHWSGILIDNGNISCSGDEITAGDARTTADMTYEDRGIKIHHNVALDTTSRALYLDSDFAQVYSNIIEGGIYSGEYGLFHGVHSVIYNNTVIGGHLTATGPTSEYYSVTDYPVWIHFINNVLSAPQDSYEFHDISVAEQLAETLANRDIEIERNYNYNRVGSFDGTNSIALNDTDYTESTYDSAFGTTNYARTSGSGLFIGGGGANDYITSGTHVVEGAVTISDAGVGGSHPYLSGITMPSYIGATDPDDSSWVAGVLDLDIAYFTSVESGSTPSWIEGAGSPTHTSMTATGVTFN